MFEYRAVIASVYDGDTIRADIDLGFGIWIKDQVLRLYGIDAWEVRGGEKDLGLAARDALRLLMPIGSKVVLQTHKDKKGKYGRWLAWIVLEDGMVVNDWLVREGHAEPAKY